MMNKKLKTLALLGMTAILPASIMWAEETRQYTFEVEPPAVTNGLAPIQGNFSVKNSTKGARNIKWRAIASADGGATWTSNVTEVFKSFSATSNTGSKTINYELHPQPYYFETELTDRHRRKLRKTASMSNIDLSSRDPETGMKGKPRSTANCYVVHAAGTNYSFPCIYGNGIKNGVTNSVAYKTQGSLNVFQDYKGNGITNPWIPNIGTNHTAILLWQDVQGLITNVRLGKDKYGYNCIYFDTMDKTVIQPGNAVIALRDADNKIVWSWHIWVTDEDLSAFTVTKKTGKNESYMPVNLGWVSTGDLIFPKQEIKVRFIQDESGLIREFTFNRPEFVVPQGTNPYYQWGRKDLMPSRVNNGTGFTEERTYYIANGYAFNTANGRADLKTSIQNPMTGYYQYTNWTDPTTYYNLWSANDTASDVQSVAAVNETEVIKTIYDPSPAGFSAPIANIYSGFTSEINGDNAYIYILQGYGKAAFTNLVNGYFFYGKDAAGHYGSLSFFPTLSYRSKTLYPGQIGAYWTARPASGRESHHPNDNNMNFAFSFTFDGRPSDSGYVSTFFRTMNTAMSRSYALSMRPMKEQ